MRLLVRVVIILAVLLVAGFAAILIFGSGSPPEPQPIEKIVPYGR